MSDPSIPLTVEEWEEWGNPNEEKWFHTMMAYSPYDNVSPSLPYPHMLITGGLHDPRVPYWEPMKWTAKLRAYGNHVRDGKQLICKIEMAGHFSASDRYKDLREKAFSYAFMMDKLLA